jgi:hypothetical protein
VEHETGSGYLPTRTGLAMTPGGTTCELHQPLPEPLSTAHSVCVDSTMKSSSCNNY